MDGRRLIAVGERAGVVWKRLFGRRGTDDAAGDSEPGWPVDERVYVGQDARVGLADKRRNERHDEAALGWHNGKVTKAIGYVVYTVGSGTSG